MEILDVELGPGWREYTSELPGYEMLGVVHRAGRNPGALARTAEGQYVQVNGPLVSYLEHDEVVVALVLARRRIKH